jgi:D-alanine-D-alanine ligase
MYLALIYGGKSVEHEISIRSAKNVLENLNKDRYTIHLIGICKKGNWYLTDQVTNEMERGMPLSIKMNHEQPAFVSGQDVLPIEIAFPMVHGTNGEDGGIQGLFKTLGVPVVGSDVLGSSVAMDKIVSKQLWSQAGLPVANFLSLDKDQLLAASFENIKASLGIPFMLKAGNLGSSVGISKVSTEEDFEAAKVESLRFSNTVLVESFVNGRELECALLGNEDIESSLPGEVILKKDYSFYTYEAKYEDEQAIEISIPAAISPAQAKKIQELCVRAFQIAQCKDYGRVDLFLTENDEVIINEINTIPGFTDVSMFPMLWKNMGIDYPDLLERIINHCLSRHNASLQLSSSYR